MVLQAWRRPLLRLVLVVGAVLLLPGVPARAAVPGPNEREGLLAAPLPKTTGYDISWPQCDSGQRPAGPFHFAVIGVNGGRMYTHNDCLGDMVRWAQQGLVVPQVYVNVNGWKPVYTYSECALTDNSCNAYQYGLKAGQYSLAWAKQNSADVQRWWLDIETGNYWNDDTALNTRVIQGMIDALKNTGHTLGIYSTPRQFGAIAGAFQPGLPGWTAGAADVFEAQLRCSPKYAFGGGKVMMVQYVSDYFDTSFVCPTDVVRRIVVGGISFNN
jgi:hypothetical protein